MPTTSVMVALVEVALVLLLFLTNSLWGLVTSDLVDPKPRQLVNAAGKGHTFEGSTTAADDFKLLQSDRTSLLVGARNVVYNLSLESLSVQQKLNWAPLESEVGTCMQKGKNEHDCQNYVRVLLKQPHDRALICGTNAYRPTCRQYSFEKGSGYRMLREFDGFAITPYDPNDNNTIIYSSKSDEVYAATVTDYTGKDPLIYRKPLSPKKGFGELRTQRNDFNVLNAPTFVASFEYGNHVYFWFREYAIESVDSSRKFGRVARVCKRDRGGPGSFGKEWSTFLKARLNCSLFEGDEVVYFDRLESISNPVKLVDDWLVFGIFTTAPGTFEKSAVCAFKMSKILEIFDKSPFLSQQTPQSLWLPMDRNKEPIRRPGMCVRDSRQLSVDNVRFLRRNPLLSAAIPNFYAKPLLISTSQNRRLTKVVAGPGISGVHPDSTDHLSLFLGTARGTVLKVHVGNYKSAEKFYTVLNEEVTVLELGEKVENLAVVVEGETAHKLTVVGRDLVKLLDLAQCQEQKTCKGCAALRDPYCAWDLIGKRCLIRPESGWKNGKLVQNLESGESKLCPQGEVDPDSYQINDNLIYPQVGASDPKSASGYSSGTLFLSVVAALILALGLGFFIGYRISQRGLFPDPSTSDSSDYSGSSSNYAPNPRALLARNPGPGPEFWSPTQHTPPEIWSENGVPPSALAPEIWSGTMPTAALKAAASQKSLNRVPAVPGLNLGDRTLFATLNNGTLPKDYKVRKVYV